MNVHTKLINFTYLLHSFTHFYWKIKKNSKSFGPEIQIKRQVLYGDFDLFTFLRTQIFDYDKIRFFFLKNWEMLKTLKIIMNFTLKP